MTRILIEIVVTLSASTAVSLMVKATAAVAIGLMIAWLARSGRAAVRHAVLASAFGALLALPIVFVMVTPVTISVFLPASRSVSVPLFDDNPLSSPGDTASARLDPPFGKSGWSLPSLAATPLSTLMFCGWLIGVAIFVVRFITGLLQVRSLRRSGLRWRDGQTVAERLAPRVRRGVDLLLHDSLSAPMTCGVLRPVVMLPEDAQNWDEKDLERALVHELEHVRRCDWAIHCLARVACAAYWFHPLVWAAWRQLTLEAERSCDDAVLGNSEAIAYANQLLGLARRRTAVRRSPALAMANRSDLAARIAALLDRRQSRGPAGALPIAACAVAVAIVLTMSPVRMVAAPQSSTAGTAQDVPKWDAVSIKRCVNAPVATVDRPGAGATQSPDRMTWNCVPLSTLINVAYTLNASGRDTAPPYPVPIERLPSWAHSERYTIEAKALATPGAGVMRGTAGAARRPFCPEGSPGNEGRAGLWG
jgi:beta-lactamase regulating signal transducer with metallopeptidase domain